MIQYINFVPIYRYLISEGDEIVRACDRHRNETVTLTKHVTKYKYMQIGWSNFSANLRVVSLKLLELTKFAWQNLSIYFNFLSAVIESTRFLMRPPDIIPPCTDHGIVASSLNPPLLSHTVPIRYLHVSKPSQYSLNLATRQLPFYSSSSTHLFIPKTIRDSST